jgi:streptogramin lyase
MTNDIMQRYHVHTCGVVSRRARRKERAGGWRRRRLVFDFLESRRLLSTNVADFPIRVEGGDPEGIASGAGSDKNIWVTLSSNNIGMINPNDTAAGVTQYPIPTLNSGAGPIAAGPDGNYWFFEETAGQFGVINATTGLITETPLLSISKPQIDGLAAGPNGYVWFTVNNTSQIGEISTANDQITLFPTFTPGAEPYGIVEGPDGNMWFTEAGTNQIGMIDPTTHAVHEFAIDSLGSDEAEGITVGSDHNLWFTLAGTSKIGVMDPYTGAMVAEYSTKSPNREPNSITLGPDGNLWFTEEGADNSTYAVFIAMVTTDGVVDEYEGGAPANAIPIDITAAQGNLWFVDSNASGALSLNPTSHVFTPYSYTATAADSANGITADSNGNLWFTQRTDTQVGALNTTTDVSTEFAVPSTGSYGNPLGITLGPDNNLWFAEAGYFGAGDKIGWINPSNDQINAQAVQSANADPYEIVSDPADGNLWFTEQGVDKVGRINPKTEAVAEFPVPTANAEPEAITVDPSGNVWFTEYNAAQIGYLSPNNPNDIQSYRVAYRPEGIVADANGNIWVSEDVSGTYFLDEYNPSNGAMINQYTVSTGHSAYALTLGPDGDIWFTDSSGNIGTLTSSGTFTFYATPNESPVAITSSPDGNIWFTGTGASGYPNVIGVVTLTATATPTQLAVATQPPGSVTATDGFGLTVAVENSAGDPDIDYTGTVTIALANNPGGDTLKGTLTAAVNQGVAVFSGLTLKVPGIGYTVTVTASGLSSTTSDAFNVTLGATRLVVRTEPPTSVQAGTAFSITVSAEDGLGNIDTTYNEAITLTLGNANGATLSGVLVVGANDGVAIFAGLSMNQPGNDYVILASSGNLTSATSNGFDVKTGPPHQLVVANGDEPPSSVIAGANFGLTIEAEDQFGYEATSFDGSVTLSISNNSNVQFQGDLTLNASGGLVTFSGLSIDTVGSYTIEATSTGLISATTSAVSVTSGQAVKLVVTSGNEPPSTITAGGAFGFVVDAVDNFGNIDPTYGKTVTIATSPAVTLTGSPAATAQDGVATFTGLSIDAVGTYTIQTSSGSLNAGTTTPVTVTPGPVFQLTVTAQPPTPITAADTFGLAIGAADQYGNAISTFSGTVIITLANNPGVTLYGTLSEPTQSGVATFSGLSITKAGNYQIQATSGSLVATTTSTFTVSAAGANQLAFGQQPGNTIAGTTIGPVTVQVEDASGNIVATDNTTQVTASLHSGAGTLTGTKTATAVNGVASFDDLEDDASGTLSLQFSAAGVAPGVSTSITISPAAAYQLLIHTQPSQTATAGQPFATQPVIDEVDRYGNLETGDNSTGITVSLATGNGPLQATTTVTESGGIATFTDLADNRAGVISLNFTGLGLMAGPSSNVFISPAATAQLVIQTPPFANVTAGNPLTDPIVIDEEDQFGNVETGDNSTVITASLASGRGPLHGTTAATVSRGVATFNTLEDDTAGTLSLKFTSGAHYSVVANATDVAAAPATQLVVTTPPPTTLSAGQAFDITISAEDQFGNLDTSYSQDVTISVPGGPGFTTAVQAKNGVAAFVGLTLPASAHAVTIQATAPGLSGAATNPIPVTSPAPTIIGESVLKLQKKNKKGKPIGKPAFAGFEIDFSAPMNPSNAGNSTNYQVDSTSTKRAKKKTGPVYKPVAFTATYHQTNDVSSVFLAIKNAAPFAKGGRITIINTPPNGVSSAGGAPLATADTDLNISPKAKVIKLS